MKADDSILGKNDTSPGNNQNNDNQKSNIIQPPLKLPSTPSSILNFVKFDNMFKINSGFQENSGSPFIGETKREKEIGSISTNSSNIHSNFSAAEVLLKIKNSSSAMKSKRKTSSSGCSSVLKDALKLSSKGKSDHQRIDGSFTKNSSGESSENKNNSEPSEHESGKEETNDEKFVLRHPRNGELSQRRDVIFKTIIRDMRKYYIQDFNETTGFVKRKRYKRKDFYLTCIDEYIEADHIKQLSMKNTRCIKDFNIYLGALIYPKEFQNILQKKPQKKIAEEIYNALYKFSLGKMKNVLIKDSIQNLFLYYYNKEIVNGHRLENNTTMSQHKGLYLEAFKVMHQVNKRKKNLF